MRNLKKLFAVVMIVAMLASMMVPALAAGVEYDDEAGILQDLNLFQGYGAGDLGLEDDLTREQGLALMLRVMGLEEEVKAMTEEEIAEGLAKVTDPETITDTWAKPYVAYAVLNGLTNGIDASTLPNVKFAGQLKMNGQEFINLMLNGMGYRTAWDDVLAKAAEVEILSAGEAVTFGTIKEMKRDQAVAIMYNALTGITSEGILLAQALVDAGAVDADKMEEYGFITPTVVPTEAPEELEIVASADNLIQVNLLFNTDLDKDSAEDKDNYEIKKVKIADAALQEDGRTVVLTFEVDSARKQQDVIDITVDGVKDVDGAALGKYTIEDIEFIDTTIPTAIDAMVVGSDTFKVIFSEPIKGDANNKLKKTDFSVNGGKSYVREVRLQSNGTEAMVELYNDLKEGEVTLLVKSGSEDFAGFGAVPKTFTLEVVPDEEAPVVIGYEKARREEVTLIWNEDIEFNGKIEREDYYHTNAKNKVQVADGDDVPVKIDGNKMTLYFDDESLMPFGTSYVYVLKEAVRDLWSNKNAQQMIQIEIEVDDTPPEVDKVETTDEGKTIEITFTEALGKDSDDKDNFTLLNDKGDEQKIIKKVTYSGKKITITLREEISGDYSIAIKDVTDTAGNKIEKTTVDFYVGDTTAPKEDKIEVTLYKAEVEDQMLRVFFDDVMASDGKYSATDVEKYVILGYTYETVKYSNGDPKVADVKLEDIEGVEIELVDDGKAVEIYIPSKVDADKDAKEGEKWINLKEGLQIQIGRLEDAAGNKMDKLFIERPINKSNFVGIKKVEATANDTIEITFDDELDDFDAEDIIITAGEKKWDGKDIAGVDIKQKDGKTIAIFTLDDAKTNLLNYNATYGEGDKEVTVSIVPEPKSETRYRKKLNPIASKVADDKIKPELYDVVDKAEGEFVKKFMKMTVTDSTYFDATIYFTEEIKVLESSPALAGSEFVITLDNDKLVNMKDYEVIKIGVDDGRAYLTIRFNGEDNDAKTGQDFEGNLEIDLVEDLEYITDLKENVLDKFKTIEVDVALKNY